MGKARRKREKRAREGEEAAAWPRGGRRTESERAGAGTRRVWGLGLGPAVRLRSSPPLGLLPGSPAAQAASQLTRGGRRSCQARPALRRGAAGAALLLASALGRLGPRALVTSGRR